MMGQDQRVLKIRNYFSKMSNCGKRYIHRSLTTLFTIPEVLTAVLMRVLVFWEMTPYHLMSVPDVSKEGASSSSTVT